MTIVIADAGPLIALSRIDKLDLLQQIFQQITITTVLLSTEFFSKLSPKSLLTTTICRHPFEGNNRI
ncbi:MAG: hypothetical protein V3V18_02630 [Methylococcales bacterium]